MDPVIAEDATEQISERQFKRLFLFDEETGLLLRKPTKPLNNMDNWRNKMHSKTDQMLDELIENK